jgi:hypothetical protein
MYGPFRNHEDCLYQQWQQALSDSISGLTVKVHPKSRTCYRIGGPVELGALESVAGLYDGLILDYYSTAATIALFSEKPIIFFDLGLRRLTRRFKDAVRKRVFYWKVDLTRSFKDQIHAGMDAYKEADTQWSNLHLERLAICDTDNETLFNACRRLIR